MPGQTPMTKTSASCRRLLWRELTARFRADIFSGLFMRRLNEGFTLKPHTLVALGSRGIEIGFDIYGPLDEAKPNQRRTRPR